MDTPSKPPRFTDLANFSSEKLRQLESTLSSILASPAAGRVYAQLIDGERDVERTWQSSGRDFGLPDEITVVSDQPDPSDHAIQAYQRDRASSDWKVLTIDTNVYLSLVIFGADTNGDVAGPAIPGCPSGKSRACFTPLGDHGSGSQRISRSSISTKSSRNGDQAAKEATAIRRRGH